jgi:hypothetical protein
MGVSMDYVFKLFTRCMAFAVLVTPLCIFGSLDVAQAERPLPNVKHDFTKQAADFKKTVDQKVEQVKAARKKENARISYVVKILGIILGVAVVIVAVIVMLVIIFPPAFLPPHL